jgi:hypothetical protein
MRSRRQRRDGIAVAFQTWRECRAEFELHRENAYRNAETDTNGVLLNDRGKRAGIDPYSLFIGPEIRALAYASEELIEHWARYPRPVFERFERNWLEKESA